KQATRSLLDMLPGANPALQRVIAEALGRLGDRQAVPALLAVAVRVQDRVLEHSLIYALIELDAREETSRGLAANDPLVQRMALMALDQMPAGGLEASTV